MGTPLIELVNVSKSFSGVQVLFGVNFKVQPREIHCLVGENGAGKSTLMKILSGVYPYGEYEGEIRLEGYPVRFFSIKDSEKAGISIIHQELSLVPEMTVYENIFLGNEIKKGSIVDTFEEIERARQLLLKVKGENINPTVKAKDLSVSMQQLVEIAKALSKNPKVLILDEPTSALSETESENLLILLKGLKEQGVTIILISHRLKEVLKVADSITVLRDGQTVAYFNCKTEEVDEKKIIKHMVGREITNLYPMPIAEPLDEPIMETKNWNVVEPNTGRYLVKDANIVLKKGEIVGLFGLVGAGRTEFGLSLFGNPYGYIISGDIILKGRKVKFKTPEDAIKQGVLYLTEDRKEKGLILINSIKENISLANLKALKKGITVDEAKEIEIAQGFQKRLNIKARNVEVNVSTLSGGTQQKVLVAKGLFAEPDVIILDEPTRGIDVGAKYEIYTLIRELASEGKAILLISSELPEILGMSDRIYIMSKGKITGELKSEEANQEIVMAYAVS
ncbi:monosaccharide ABC transporter ATP-binding protein, CUT2 family [Thermoanaerobacter thermohydrosulfuricus]|uniref:ABC-type sugar transport system, ATPase component n=3 Tax=Thermoanaerobacter TaxID=1754 RepID=I9KRA3_9THEO|nr:MULTISPECIES: sugar ABC transporter ATP-binding protein [Thermoanaerobacter]EIV99320.1 ABC-type sugar transport system, ATPase component [Thermoanaerobacter siderophilus SR4]EMT39194.1 ABC-type sugar transport system, ATPase component [Thermoanaerobacter thermohydrosulfuricus WC1]SDG44883.1 monosaccharide ABC transporter ATP-binding protein, CUT2 family [Thermoanaerobacter thermohydrosulfuricus]